jgi:hypothetical protein
MVDLYSLTAPTTARKEAEARAARKAYEKRKTRAAQVTALWRMHSRRQAATSLVPLVTYLYYRYTDIKEYYL